MNPSAGESPCNFLSRPPGPVSDDRIALGVVVLIVLGVGWVLHPLCRSSPTQELLGQAAGALAEHRYQEAEALAREVLQSVPNSSRALLIAGAAASGLQRSAEALAYYHAIQDDGGPDAVSALRGAGIRASRLGLVADAEHALRRVLEYAPGDLLTHQELARLLLRVGRSWDALPHQFAALQGGVFNGNRLVELASIEIPGPYDDQFVQDCCEAVQDDPTPRLATARNALWSNRREDAEQLLRQIIAAAPGQLDAQAQLGRLLLDRPEFLQWQTRLPPEAGQHPEIWVTYGLWARQHGQEAAAVRCFGEALRLYPEHRMACQHLGALLHAIGDTHLAQLFSDRVVKLNQLQQAFASVTDGVPVVRQIAETLESLDRRWEAIAWYHTALRAYPDLDWARSGVLRLAGQLDYPAAVVSASANPAAQIDLARYPLPNWRTASGVNDKLPIRPELEPCPVHFVDRAAESDLNFRYYNGADPEQRRAYMFEYSGGGVATLDYDGDGWPDIYLTQGCPWPLQPQQDQYRDRLFRNLGNGRFEDVTAAAGLGDNGLSQGATVGDYDNDGFPDLYVGNIGANRFYHNNGDGTFTDITEQTGTATHLWTSSCLLADLNGDALPDLYCVTYLAGPEVYEKECVTNGRPIQCAPQSFRAEQDHLYLNLGDGRFRDVSEESGVAVPEGKGLGIVAADFDGSRRLSLFVSNDTTPNFFFVNQTERGSQQLKFVESAMFRGLACDTQGRSRSGMGVAIGDANQDGLLDVIITNFHKEAIGFYVQQSDQTFVDTARTAALEQPSYEMLSWGTQFLDGELDGQLDLVVASGHINDFSYQGLPYKMRPQYYRNLGDGRFEEVPGSSLGDYYQQQHLGRAIARLDWNRDGLEDYCTTHVDEPVALLTNATPQHGHYLTLRLIGTQSSRDAIGTTVQLQAGKHRWTRQLTAGDGFYASNERQLTLGLGSETAVEELRVLWPSGLDQTFRDLSVDTGYLLVEGRTEPISVRIP